MVSLLTTASAVSGRYPKLVRLKRTFPTATGITPVLSTRYSTFSGFRFFDRRLYVETLPCRLRIWHQTARAKHLFPGRRPAHHVGSGQLRVEVDQPPLIFSTMSSPPTKIRTRLFGFLDLIALRDHQDRLDLPTRAANDRAAHELIGFTRSTPAKLSIQPFRQLCECNLLNLGTASSDCTCSGFIFSAAALYFFPCFFISFSECQRRISEFGCGFRIFLELRDRSL